MKVFISHSWKNKTQAQKIADELKAAGVDLWLDANNLLPGQLIQESIDEVLEKIDVVILVWTKEASESGGVAAEIFTGSRLKKIIIPCKLDNTSMDAFPYVKQIKGIRFNDFNDGLGRLKMVLLNYMTREFNMNDNESIRMMNEFMGTLETANHLVHKEDIKNKGTQEEKDFWIKKVGETEAASLEKLKEEERIGRENTVFLNEKMETLKISLNSREKVGQVLKEMKQHKYADRPDIKVFIDKVQDIYNSFGNTETDDAIIKYKKELEEKLRTSHQQLKSSLGFLADLLFAVTYENVSYFFLSSADHLQKLLDLSRQKGAHPLIADCANELLNYIKTPGGVIDNTQYGILGYADDAYLIHSLLATMQQEGVLDTSTWNIDWNKITAGNEFVFTIVGNNIKTQLDQNILSFCQALVAKYNPQTTTQTEMDKLQRARDDVWKAKLMSLETAMIHHPVY